MHRLTEPVPGHCEGQEAMSLSRMPVGMHTAFVRHIMSHPLRINDSGRYGSFVNGAASLEIDADFQAVPVETARPLECVPTLKIVPLYTHSRLGKIAKERTPFSFDPGPDAAFHKLSRLPHAPVVLRSSLKNKGKVSFS